MRQDVGSKEYSRYLNDVCHQYTREEWPMSQIVERTMERTKWLIPGVFKSTHFFQLKEHLVSDMLYVILLFFVLVFNTNMIPSKIKNNEMMLKSEKPSK